MSRAKLHGERRNEQKKLGCLLFLSVLNDGEGETKHDASIREYKVHRKAKTTALVVREVPMLVFVFFYLCRATRETISAH